MSVFCRRAISDTRVIYGRRAESSQHSRIVMMLPSVTLSQINRAISRGEPRTIPEEAQQMYAPSSLTSCSSRIYFPHRDIPHRPGLMKERKKERKKERRKKKERKRNRLMSTSQRRRRTQGDSGIDVNDFSQRRARYLGAFAYYSDHGDRVVEAETAGGEGRKTGAIIHLSRGRAPDQGRWRPVLRAGAGLLFLRCRARLLGQVPQGSGEAPAVLLPARSRSRGMTLR